MKRIAYFLTAVAVMLSGVSCVKNGTSEVKHTPAVQTLSPLADESGAVKAFQGTKVSVTGINLDQVKSVVVGTKDAKVLSQSLKELSFEIPEFPEFEQSDNVHSATIQMFGPEEETVCYTHPYFISVPVTDALVSGFEPKAGTVGTEITVSGRNLEQVTKIKFADVELLADVFVSHTADAIKFKAPAVTTSGADNPVVITAIWGAGRTIDVTASEKFNLTAPVFDAYTQTAAAKLGEEIDFSGKNLDLVKSVVWKEYELLIASQSATALKVKVPSTIEEMTPVIAEDVLVAKYGEPAQDAAICQAFKIDTTPVGPKKPVFGSIKPTDTEYTSIFLGREVTVTGENMASIEKFTLDGVEALLSDYPTDLQAKFVVPSTISGDVAREVDLVAYYNGDQPVNFGKVKVYPFFYTKGLKLGLGSNSKSTYCAGDRAFLMLREGAVISASEWKTRPVDQYALESSNSVIAGANKAAAGKETEYNSVSPYVVMVSNSSNVISINCPANSTGSGIKNHYIDGTSVSTTYGTPIVKMRIVTEEEAKDVRDAVVAGTLEDVKMYTIGASTNAPKLQSSESGSQWVKGSVICLQHINYATATKGTNPTGVADLSTIAYIYVKDVTCTNEDGTTAKADRSGYIEFDLYCSKDITVK